jgi:hypothetical protein
VPVKQLHGVMAAADEDQQRARERVCVATHTLSYVTSRHMWRPAASTEQTG